MKIRRRLAAGHVDILLAKCLTQLAGKRQRVRAIAMQANAVGLHLHPLAAQAFHLTFLNHGQRLAYRLLVTFHQRTGLTTRHQRTIRHIAAIGKHLLAGG